ncbi:MAG TPA: UbiA family prenyltransferase, partial [Candidatus Thermoplasmatota archaeon]|nr:UbiA family prenyltransferase [Candidatus Thermoplasmatota archaeon]
MAAQPNKVTITRKLFAHFETMRPYTVIWCGLVSLAGACLSWGKLPPLDVTLLSLIVPIMGWISGLYLSDFLDRKLDKIEKPHRPIPSGRIKPYEAIIVGSI